MYYVSKEDMDPTKLFQGDIFEAIPCPYLEQTEPTIFRESGEELVPYEQGQLENAWNNRDELILVRARKYQIILLSQTCDIHEEGFKKLQLAEDQKYDCQFILFAPLLPLTDLDQYPKLRKRQRDRQALETQNIKGGFYLPEYPAVGIHESIVYFHLVASMFKSRSNRFSSFNPRKRLASLRSPFREALAHKFGDCFSRVALPSGVEFEQ